MSRNAAAARTPLQRWLCPTEADVARMIDSAQRARRSRHAMAVLTTIAMALMVPWFGWEPLVVAIACTVSLALIDLWALRAARPEYANAAGFVMTTVAFAAGAHLTGGPTSPILALMCLPYLLLPNRFRRQVTYVGLGFAAVALALVTVIAAPAATLAHPQPVAFAALLIGSGAYVAMSLNTVERRLRRVSEIDALTGAFNRSSLERIFDDLRARCAASGQALSLVLVDLDHFKAINDEHGHETGDRVLAQATNVLRHHLRGNDLLFRLGGEEFAILLPGAGLDRACEIAERQRDGLEADFLGGIAVTLSAGIAESRAGDREWVALYREADEALRVAKANGRNRVVTHRRPPAPETSTGIAVRT